MRWFLAVFLFLVGCSAAEPPEPTPAVCISATPDPNLPPMPVLNPDEISRGEQLYQTHCAPCHGTELQGAENWEEPGENGALQAPPHDLTGHSWQHSDTTLIDAIKQGGQRLSPSVEGVSPMPPFADLLTDEDITALLAYIKNHWPDPIRQLQWQVTFLDSP